VNMNWDADHMNLAMKIVMERFGMNSVAGHFVPPTFVDKMASTVPRNRFDFKGRVVVDNQTINLHEPFAKCNFTLAQVDEFGSMTGASLTGELAMQNRMITTITRAASALARWHDVLFFVGVDTKQQPLGVEVGQLVTENVPVSLRAGAMQAETDLNIGPVLVKGQALNEGLVAAVYQAVLELETRGYYARYHLVLGERLWEELYRPSQGSLVLPRDRIEHTLLGGDFHRTTTLPRDEALIASLDGPTFDCVIAGSMDQYPSFEALPTLVSHEGTVYQARVVERFAPRVRENQAIVRLQIDPAQYGNPLK
jgi:Encapsulating protein for peroxidase